MLAGAVNSMLRAESEEQLSAGRYQRSDERTDYRNGSRERELNTRIGRITLHVPRHRNVPFRTLVFENYSRSEAALIAGMAEMVVFGEETLRGFFNSPFTAGYGCLADASAVMPRRFPAARPYDLFIMYFSSTG
jgi:hypothetical protein